MTNTTKPALSAAPVGEAPPDDLVSRCVDVMCDTLLKPMPEGVPHYQEAVVRAILKEARTPPAASVEVEELKDFIQSASFSSRSADDGDTIFCQIYTPGYPPQHKGSFGFYVKDLRAILLLLTRGPDQGGPAMTAVSDETGRDAFVAALASLAAAISLLERTPRSKKAAASDKMFDQMIVDYKKALEEGRAALSAAPVAQEPVAWRYEIQHGPDGEKDWAWVYDAENNFVCTAKTYHAAAIVRAATPPATPAGVGADEIAQIIATKCFDPRVIDSSGKPFWKKSQWREAQQAANAILALLSRAGDQK